MKHLTILFALAILAFPSSTFAADPRPGTDDYLRDVLHWTDERLAQGMNTEDRKPFAFATGEGRTQDVLGDVVTRLGTSGTASVPWMDLTGASLVRDDAAETWVVTWQLAQPFPADTRDKTQFLFYADRDGDASNNEASEGVRGDMDAEFSIERDDKGNWVTDFRWYNPEAQFWAVNQETASTSSFEQDKIVLHIPYVEMAQDMKPHWRALAIVEHAGTILVDVAPTIGFPPAKDSPEKTLGRPLWMWSLSTITPPVAILLSLGSIAAAYLLIVWLRARHRGKERD